jgi:hypothetical protein
MRRHGVGLLVGYVDPEADYAFGVDADEGAIDPTFGSSGWGDRVGMSSDLEASDAPRIDQGDVVDDERDPSVVRDVVGLTAG